MLNHNHKNQVCAYAESLVAYLYDEASAAEKVAFEAHLENCATCADELAEIGFARTAVHEWRVADFDVLPTPVFELPARTVQTTMETEKSASWFDDWRRIFSFKPALAMSSLVVLVAFFGIAAFLFNVKTDDQVAEKLNDEKTTKPIVSPTVEIKTGNSKEPNTAGTPETADAEVKNPSLKNDDRKTATSKPAPLKVSTVAPKNNAVKAVPTDVRRNPKPNTATKADVPRLGDAEDEEDDSIRLADLFDEVGVE